MKAVREGQAQAKMTALAAISLIVGLAMAPPLSASQEKDLLRDQAKAMEAKYLAVGEPRDRCSLSASMGGGPVVVRTMPTSTFRPGDKLVVLNGTSTTNKTTDDVVALLRQIAPDAVIKATIERDGHQVDLSVACINSRPIVEPVFTALKFAARGKFDECVDTLSRASYVDTSLATMKAQCASVSRNAAKYNVSGLMAQAMDMWIADAGYSPSLRPDVVQKLRNVEGPITQGQGAARYQALVRATQAWPGGETVFASSGPDWALFRRNAETTLRARLIDPDSARIQWTRGFLLGTWKPFLSKTIEGYWTCGLINARNRMGGYTGSTAFVVVMDPSGFVKYSEIGESKDFDLLTAACGKSGKLLPPAPPELLAAQAGTTGSGGASIADELKKLVDLHNSGALTDAEFTAAKQRLLQGSSR